MFNKITKIINITLILPILSLVFFEFMIRIFIFFFTLNLNIFSYGINNNISLTLHSLKNKEFYISDNSIKLSTTHEKEIKNNDQIWIFGGSTSNRGFCDSKNISWVDLFETDLKKKNYAKNGVNSSFSLKVFTHELERYGPPKSVIWANKINEVLHSKRSNNFTNKFYYSLNSLKLSLKNTFVIFYLADELFLRLFDKLEIDIRNEKIHLENSDYVYSAKKYYLNTKKAIELSKIYKIENFFIVSLFNQLNMKDSDTIFYKYYIKEVNKLINSDRFVKFIDTKKYLNSKDKETELFCDIMHQNYKGKIITAKIISDIINDK